MDDDEEIYLYDRTGVRFENCGPPVSDKFFLSSSQTTPCPQMSNSAFMDNSRGSTASLGDVDVTSGDSDTNETKFYSHVDKVAGNDRGPWSSDSSNDYSRPFSPKSGVLSKANVTLAAVMLLTLAVGVVLGILIGTYGIQRCEDNATRTHVDSAQQNGQTTAPPGTTPAITASPDTTTKSVLPCPPCQNPTANATECSVCRTREAVTAKENEDNSCFAPLTSDELSKVVSFLKEENLVGSSTLASSRLSQVYLHPARKQDVLNFLDHGGAFPGRYALVQVLRGDISPPDVMQYKVGPVNETYDKWTVEKLLHDGEVHFNRRPRDYIEDRTLRAKISPHLQALKPLLQASFDGRYYGKDLGMGFSTSSTANPADRTSSMYLYYTRGTSGATMHIMPVQCLVHHAGIDTSKWYVSDFYYLDQGPFSSGQALYEAYSNGSLSRTFTLPAGYFDRVRNAYKLVRNDSQPLREHADIPPPRTYEPEGPRYTVQGQQVRWMGWRFDFSADTVRGPGVFDVRFKGERMAYQISLQDVTLVYASGTTGAGFTPAVLSDTLFNLGAFRGGPRLGLDCPDRARHIYTTVLRGSGGSRKVAACIFEAAGQAPLWRHYSGFTKGLANNYLVIRAPMNLGNYDYSAEWRFYLDGHVDTTVSASGFLYTSVWDPENPMFSDKTSTPFGYRIGDSIVGSIHDHSFLFKVDVDVLGRNNSFEVTKWKGGDVVSALNSQQGINVAETPPIFPYNITRYVRHEILEKEGGLNMDSLKPEIWTIVNEHERNKWGVKRGYRIFPLLSAAETLPVEHPLLSPWLHMKYHCALTKHKDNELYGTASLFDISHPTPPVGGLSTMMDGEDIRNEDLVAWVTAKFMHVPTSEDVPMTMAVERGFSLKPYNYFDTSPTFDIEGHYDVSSPHTITPCYEPGL